MTYYRINATVKTHNISNSRHNHDKQTIYFLPTELLPASDRLQGVDIKKHQSVSSSCTDPASASAPKSWLSVTSSSESLTGTENVPSTPTNTPLVIVEERATYNKAHQPDSGALPSHATAVGKDVMAEDLPPEYQSTSGLGSQVLGTKYSLCFN